MAKFYLETAESRFAISALLCKLRQFNIKCTSVKRKQERVCVFCDTYEDGDNIFSKIYDWGIENIKCTPKLHRELNIMRSVKLNIMNLL